jgi:hypothetical protein
MRSGWDGSAVAMRSLLFGGKAEILHGYMFCESDAVGRKIERLARRMHQLRSHFNHYRAAVPAPDASGGGPIRG